MPQWGENGERDYKGGEVGEGKGIRGRGESKQEGDREGKKSRIGRGRRQG